MSYKLAVDENIASGYEAFSVFGEVRLINGRKVTRDEIKDCDVLIVRSVTKVNADLLENTKIKFVGTATIGYDHIDTKYLTKKGIAFVNAPGSNSYSVAEYVFSALLHLSDKYGFSLKTKSIGIVGVGNIGKKVEKFAKALGMDVIKNDPPRADTGEKGFSSLEEALACDIVTFHVPLQYSGKYKTFHLLNKNNIKLLRKNSILINSSRGAVVSNTDLLKTLESENIIAVLDVWENEPSPSVSLIKKVEIATPHIAGYSFDGKLNGTRMIFEALNNFLNENKKWKFGSFPENKIIDCDNSSDAEEALRKIFEFAYSAENDSRKFKKELSLRSNVAEVFDKMRKNYPLRLELLHFTAKTTDKKIKETLNAFRIKTL